MITLKCDWNVSTYCVIPFAYNLRLEIQAHLWGHTPNLTVGIIQLQQEVD